MLPASVDVEEVLARYRANLRTHGVEVALRSLTDHAAVIEVDLAAGASSCSGECGYPLPALLNLLQAELGRVPGLENVRWSTVGTAQGAP
ncbi:MAG: hypothetical protein WBF81_02420 [Thermoplasmata archaeon]